MIARCCIDVEVGITQVKAWPEMGGWISAGTFSGQLLGLDQEMHPLACASNFRQSSLEAKILHLVASGMHGGP